MEQAINIRKMFNGEDRYKIAPIPSEFNKLFGGK